MGIKGVLRTLKSDELNKKIKIKFSRTEDWIIAECREHSVYLPPKINNNILSVRIKDGKIIFHIAE